MHTQLNFHKFKQSASYPLLVLLLLISLLLSACAKKIPTPLPTDTPAPTPVVVDVNLLYVNPWVLVAYGNPDDPTVIEQGAVITAQFSPEDQVSGASGCNNYSGTFQAAQDGALTISPLATTRMACPQGMELENAYLTALQSAQSFSFSSQGRLEIKYGTQDNPDKVLIYTSSAKPLVGTSWILVAYGDPASPQPAPAEVVISAVFSLDGMLSGNSGCNHYNTSYTLQDDQLTLSPIAMTEMACPIGMEIEQAYLQALGTAQQLEVSGQKLTITYDQGAGVLIYTSASLPLEYTLWTLSVLNGQPVSVDMSITAVFTPGEVENAGNINGSSGCNSYSSAFTLDGNNLAVQMPAVTMMACPTGMDMEQAYLQVLQTSASYEIFGDKLVLTGSSGSLMYTANDTPLTGALWQLVSLGDVKNPQVPVAGSSFALQFNRIPGAPSGILAGTTGCNEYSAAFAASLTELKINTPVSTQNRSCVPGLTDQEELYFLALNDSTTYRISGNTLVIPYDNDRQSLVFEGTQLEVAKRPPLKDLNGTTWFLWYLDTSPLVAGTSIYAQFAINPEGASGTVSGSAGCNSYVASFGQDLGVQTTLNANQICNQPAGVMNQEHAYIGMLSRSYGYWQTGDQLLVNTGQGVLTYRSTQPPESLDQAYLLTGRTWYLVSYKDKYSVAGAQEPYTLFQANGIVSGFTGCNSYQGSYSTDVQQIAITNLNSAKAPCSNQALQDQEQTMLAILSTAKTYQVVDTVMQLVSDQGILNYSLTPINRPEEIQPPQAVIKMPAEAQADQVVTFDGTASFGQVPILSWKWDFGDGVQGTGAVVDHVYRSAGIYKVQLLVTDQSGYQDSESQEIRIVSPVSPTPTPTQAPPTEPTPTMEPTQGPEPTATPEPTQPPQVIPPQAAIQGPSQGYVGEPVTFDASASAAGSSPITSYTWNFGDGTSAGPSSDPRQTTIFNQAGNYQVSVVVTDQSGQSSSATVGMVISTRLDTPVVWRLEEYGNQPILPGTAITLQFLEGEIAGFAGCNTYTGNYSAILNPDGTYGVMISDLTITRVACPTEIMEQESDYLELLPTVIGAQLQENMLSLSYPAGESYPQGSLVYYQVGTAAPR